MPQLVGHAPRPLGVVVVGDGQQHAQAGPDRAIGDPSTVTSALVTRCTTARTALP